ncbi:LLM class flavin-dependent oxidoreductase, partial [Streptomyces sp. NPDC056160]|uniref:LLM class flavin-dependent oxidoreductase n=1 Tax=Streptomyces sp. NPDC056160 TaxID=3345731 RepID=UPI0035D7D146
MTAPPGRRLLHLAAALDRPSAYDAASYVESARLAESGGLDFVTLDDGPARPGPAALAVLSQVAPATHRVGLVPTVPAAHTEPGAVRAAVAALDRVSHGRAGWRLGAPAGPAAAEAARPRGGTEPDGTEGAGTEGAGREGAGAGRDGVGRGAPVAPWSPQGPLVRVADATGGHACGTAARHADVVLVSATHPVQAAAVRDRLRDEAARSGRDPGALRVLADLAIDLRDGEYAAERGWEFPRSEHGREPGGGGGLRRTARGPLYRGGPVDLAELIAAWHREGAVDGFHLVPSDPRRDLERLVNGTVTLLQHRGLFRTFYPGGTLREHLGLARPVDRRT